jgi:hypothetical protein
MTGRGTAGGGRPSLFENPPGAGGPSTFDPAVMTAAIYERRRKEFVDEHGGPSKIAEVRLFVPKSGFAGMHSRSIVRKLAEDYYADHSESAKKLARNPNEDVVVLLLAPVSDVKELAKRIEIGSIEIDEVARRISVQVDPEKVK